MSLDEYFKTYSSMTKKAMMKEFNNLSVQDRLDFLEILSDEKREVFIQNKLNPVKNVILFTFFLLINRGLL